MSKELVAEQVKALGGLLRETQKDHHQVYIDTDGDHPDWAIWYADYLFGKLPSVSKCGDDPQRNRLQPSSLGQKVHC